MAPYRLTENQAVKGSHAVHRGESQAQQPPNGHDGTVGNPAMAALDDFQRLDTSGLGLLVVFLFPENRGFVVRVQFKTVTADQFGCVRGCCHHQRSTSAITKSILPRWAIMSGTKPPRIKDGIC